jgi:hypothetical protein
VPCGTNFCVPCGTALCMSCGTIFCVPCGTTLSAWGVLQLHPSVQTVQLGDRSHSNRREAALIQTVARRTASVQSVQSVLGSPSQPIRSICAWDRPSQSVQSVLGTVPANPFNPCYPNQIGGCMQSIPHTCFQSRQSELSDSDWGVC